MPSDPEDSQLHEDLRKIGRLPRWIATIQFLVLEAAFIPAFITYKNGWYVLIAAIPLVVVLLAYRIRARLDGHSLVINSFFRNYTYPLARVETFVCMPYQGIWSGGGPADWLGLYQIDVEGLGCSWSKSLPATMCTRKTANRLELELNQRVDLLQSSAP